MKLGFVCTNYNNSSFTKAAIDSLRAGAAYDAMRVIVVDNRSRDDEVAALRRITEGIPGVDVIFNPENVGYFAGLNIGIRRLRETHPDVEHMVVGNNDLEFPPDFVSAVEQCHDQLAEWPVVAPDLVTPEGVHQNPHVLYPISRARQRVWDAYYFSYPVAIAVRFALRFARRFATRPENMPTSELFRSAGPIEQGYGACYVIGPAFFKTYTQLFAPTFMMQEEYFLSEQLKVIDQMTYYEPRIVVRHRGHGAMNSVPGRRQWEIARDSHAAYVEFRGLSPAERRTRILGATAARP